MAFDLLSHWNAPLLVTIWGGDGGMSKSEHTPGRPSFRWRLPTMLASEDPVSEKLNQLKSLNL